MAKKTIITQITECIERIIDMGEPFRKNIIIYPCGDVGIQIVNIMKNIYCVEPAYMIDNRKCKYSDKIHDISVLKQIETDKYVLILASTNPDIYDALKVNVYSYFSKDRVIELECMQMENKLPVFHTTIGRYSYGPICRNHPWIKSIGSFCSFAGGVDVVLNHEIRYVTTHPIIYEGKSNEDLEYSFEAREGEDYYLPGVEPISELVKKQKRAVIGNDVWLGKNVIITNGSYIGNGVIAAAGAVITKDVPDYAIVAGVPAKIIRFRYLPEQIDALNRIEWWNWTDDEIRERFDDFYLPIDEFIDKYLNYDK